LIPNHACTNGQALLNDRHNSIRIEHFIQIVRIRSKDGTFRIELPPTADAGELATKVSVSYAYPDGFLLLFVPCGHLICHIYSGFQDPGDYEERRS